MKPDRLYRELTDLAEKLGIRVLEQNFRTTGVHVKSGYCKVKDKDHFIIDKHLRINQKNELIAEFLVDWPIDSIYIVPAVREYLDRFKPMNTAVDNSTEPS